MSTTALVNNPAAFNTAMQPNNITVIKQEMLPAKGAHPSTALRVQLIKTMHDAPTISLPYTRDTIYKQHEECIMHYYWQHTLSDHPVVARECGSRMYPMPHPLPDQNPQVLSTY